MEPCSGSLKQSTQWATARALRGLTWWSPRPQPGARRRRSRVALSNRWCSSAVSQRKPEIGTR